MSNSVNGRKLRPLMPRPSTTNSAPYCCNCIRRTDLFALNHHLANASDHHEQSYKTEVPLVSSRWNPTPEQLHGLEEIYTSETQTPTSEQIQQIASKLRRFGKIEGKNVFYWFQNHKARERQKRRRMLEYSASEEQHLCDHLIERKESELSRTGFDVGQRKKWSTPSNCSNISEECVSMHRTVVAEGRTEGRTQFEEREFQQKSSLRAKHAVWQMMDDLPTTLTTEDEIRESQTLALFPLQSENRNVVHVAADDTTEVLPTAATININFTTPNQFFEFL